MARLTVGIWFRFPTLVHELHDCYVVDLHEIQVICDGIDLSREEIEAWQTTGEAPKFLQLVQEQAGNRGIEVQVGVGATWRGEELP